LRVREVTNTAAAHACTERLWDEVVVVTADRALRERVTAAGGSSVDPSWLIT
jgi:hypothetical protein